MNVQERWGCPSCGHKGTRVLDTRQDVGFIRRRRQCKRCGQVFWTYELICDEDPMFAAELSSVLRAHAERMREVLEKETARLRSALGGDQ